MKKKQQTVRKQKPPPVKNHGRPRGSPGAEKPSVSVTDALASPSHAVERPVPEPPKAARPNLTPFAKPRRSASEILALSNSIRLGQHWTPAVPGIGSGLKSCATDSLRKAFANGLQRLRQQRRSAAPEPEPSNPLRDVLKACATDSLEQYFAEWFPLTSLPAFSISAENPEIKNKLNFRCFLVPALCRYRVQRAEMMPQKMSLFLCDYSTRVRAFERLDAELRARASKLGAGKTNVRPPGLPNWLNCTPEVATQRLERFDVWRKAALRSFWHFYGQFCADMGLADPKASLAAYRGFAQRETPLPESLRVLLEPLGPLNRSANRSLSIKNQTKPKMRGLGRGYEAWLKRQQAEKVPSLIIDCWLIEIWPLALAEEWTYESILTIAEAKFGALDELNDFKKLQKRCNRIKLRLAAVRREGGRVLESLRITHPLAPVAQLATGIQGIAENPRKWMHGAIS
ncbi:MAG: hypothetical protein RL514_3462 [Verrucomicrobiota bacterium]|jgi:hypothetical protein